MRGSLKSILSRVERIRADVVGRPGETNWDDLVVRLQLQRLEREVQGGRSLARAHHVAGAELRLQPFFELARSRPLTQPSRFQDAAYCIQFLGTEARSKRGDFAHRERQG